jgi:hypothetical protein
VAAAILVLALALGPATAAPLQGDVLLVAQADDQEELAWSLVKDTADPTVLERFIAQYPSGPHTAEAQAKLAALSEQGGEIDVPDVPVPSPSVEPRAATPAPTGDIAKSIQGELRRAGCYAGTVDGDWGPRSRNAVAAFNGATGLALPSAGPTPERLAALGERPGIVCRAEARKSVAGTPPAGITSPASGCYLVTVTVDTLNSSGTKWDPWPGKIGIVDPITTETTTGARSQCTDSYSCSLRVDGAGSQMSFNIVDGDPNAPDPIGVGTCKAGRSCRVGSASLTMQPC